MNLEQMETALKRFGFESNDPLATWLNAALRDVETSADWSFLVNTLQTSTTAKVETIAIPERTAKIISVRDLTNEKKLQYWDIRKFHREIMNTTGEGLPEIYMLMNGVQTLKLFPIPQAVYNMEVVVLQESKELIASTDEPEIEAGKLWPKPFHFPIVLRAAILALDAENEEERAKAQIERYERMMEDLRKRYIQATADEPAVVQDVQGYGSDSIATRWAMYG